MAAWMHSSTDWLSPHFYFVAWPSEEKKRRCSDPLGSLASRPQIGWPSSFFLFANGKLRLRNPTIYTFPVLGVFSGSSAPQYWANLHLLLKKAGLVRQNCWNSKSFLRGWRSNQPLPRSLPHLSSHFCASFNSSTISLIGVTGFPFIK